MYVSGKPIGLWSAVAMGVGAMVGAGIFALLGEAAAVAGSAVYISFAIGGVVALASGYSLGRLGARYPSAGGLVEYITQGWGTGVFTGAMSLILYAAGVVSLSVVAKAFGNYAAALLFDEAGGTLWPNVFAVGVVVLFVAINVRGARDVALWETITVLIKFGVLVAMSIAGLLFLQPDLLSPSHYPATPDILLAIGTTFFAYEGFRVITNTAEDMPDPARMLPRAMAIAILLVMALYVAISLAVFGNLPTDQVVAAKDYALAEAARPVFGEIGFRIVAITAVISTASAINANLYAITNVAWRMALDGELPGAFAQPIGRSREGLLISGLLVILLALSFELGEIATVGAILVLWIHGITHVGHLRLTHQTGARPWLVGLAAVFSFAAMAIALWYLSQQSGAVFRLLVGFIGVSVAMEWFLRQLTGRKIQPRCEMEASDKNA